MPKRMDAGRLAILETTTFFLTAAAQSALRNVYALTGRSLAAGILGEANGSIWEHMKIVFFSYFILSAVEYFAAGVSVKRFFSAKAAGCLFLFFSVPAFLSLCGFLAGRICAVPDVAGLFVLTGGAFFVSWRLMRSRLPIEKSFLLWAVCMGILLGMFLSLTVWALPGGVFLDPKTGDYGLFHHAFSVGACTRFT